MITHKLWLRLLVATAAMRSHILSVDAVKVLHTNEVDYLDYNSIISEPDAYGSVPVPGFNLNKPYPGLWDDSPSLSQQWHLDLRFHIYKINDSTTTTTHISTQLRPPPAGSEGGLFDPQTGNLSIPSNISDTWTLMLLNVVITGYTDTPVVAEGNNKQNGSCPETVMSQACQDELREAIRMSTTVLNGTNSTSLSTMPLLNKCPSCKRFPKWLDLKYVPLDVSGRAFNWSTMFTDLGKDNEGETPTLYDKYGLRTFPIIMIWGHSNTTEEVNKPLSADHVVIACVKADEFAPGVAKPKGSDGVGRFASLHGGGLWKVFLIVIGAVWSLPY